MIPERIVGFGRRRQSLAKDVIVAVDQSGSMADSVVYASLFGSVLAQLPSLRTRLVVFDTSVTDLTPVLHDPVDVLFGVQLGGGTDIAQAVGYCRQLVTRPADTVLILISDLFEGGNADLLRGAGARAHPGRCHRAVPAGAERRGRADPRSGDGRRPRRAGCHRHGVHPRPVPRRARRHPRPTLTLAADRVRRRLVRGGGTGQLELRLGRTFFVISQLFLPS